MEMEYSQWKSKAENLQEEFSEHLKLMDENSFDMLQKRLAVALYGIPKKDYEKSHQTNIKMEDYTPQQQSNIRKIALCILEHQKHGIKIDGIYVSFIFILGRLKSGPCEKRNFKDLVFRTPGKRGIGNIFIDQNCRVYSGWEDFLNNNTLPEATICYPKNGLYSNTSNYGKFGVDFMNTPACNVGKKVLIGFDIATTATSTIAGSVMAASLFVPMAAPIVWSMFGISAAAGFYGFGRSVESLVDRSHHEQTLNPTDSQARAAWLGITTPVIGLAAGGATAYLARASRLGVAVTEGAEIAINVTNGINCVSHCLNFTHDLHRVIECIAAGKLSALDIIQCIASALLFANAVITAHSARLLLKQLSSGNFRNVSFRNLSQTVQRGGELIRITNFYPNIISMAIPWGGLTMRLPHELFPYLKSIAIYLAENPTAEMSAIILGLLPYLSNLWEKVQEHTESHEYKKLWKNKSHSNFSLENQRNFENLISPSSETLNEKSTRNMNFQEHDDKEEIVILDNKSEESKKMFQKAIDEILQGEQLSEFDIISITHYFYGRISKDLEKKEKEFQDSCKRARMSEKQMEMILGIEGIRAQFFANDIIQSYKDIKLSAMKQDFKRFTEDRGIQVPLVFNGSIEIFWFKSTLKRVSKAKQFLEILERVDVPINDPSCCIAYKLENSCFLSFTNPNAKYKMAGLVNYAENNDHLMGLIIREEN